ncbi:40S ribosomal protein S12 [Vitis vinifera]|uniref:40S ribosomal protein S12 n=1 Tax=Vitis vinifera TaxID=29760 RepID=A0A438G4C1_VITVI|nr:40S ribosomal protein S12 [Vitis vinifera]
MKLLWLRLLVPLLGETIDLKTTLLLVLRKSLVHVGLMRGFHEGAEVIEKHAAQLCVLAEWVGEHMKNSGEVVQ